MLGLVIYGLAGGCSDTNMMPILCRVADPRYRATGYGIMNLAGSLSGGLAIYLAGILRDRHVDLGVIFTWATAEFGALPLILFFSSSRG